ncbi:MAG: hypothetical protein OES99_05120, partial [Gammaproteobacteria bacterium]|nr:hypothetical protein [Gammaproteobacteria bacterium]
SDIDVSVSEFRVSIRHLSERTGLDFSGLEHMDTISDNGSPVIGESLTRPRRLSDWTDIRL